VQLEQLSQYVYFCTSKQVLWYQEKQVAARAPSEVGAKEGRKQLERTCGVPVGDQKRGYLQV
jgi:hypothetical protein